MKPVFGKHIIRDFKHTFGEGKYARTYNYQLHATKGWRRYRVRG